LNGLPWTIIPDEENFIELSNVFSWHIYDGLGYKDFPRIGPLIAEAFSLVSKGQKIKWINTASQKDFNYPQELRRTFFVFACENDDAKLTDLSLQLLAKVEHEISSTSPSLVEKVYNASIPKHDKLVFLNRVRGRNDIPEETRERAEVLVAYLEKNE
jgi:hypothetical protein